MVPWLRTHASTAAGAGSIPGWGTGRFLYATQWDQDRWIKRKKPKDAFQWFYTLLSFSCEIRKGIILPFIFPMVASAGKEYICNEHLLADWLSLTEHITKDRGRPCTVSEEDHISAAPGKGLCLFLLKCKLLNKSHGFPQLLSGKESACNVRDTGDEMWVWFLGWRFPEKSMSTHSSIFAWKIPWTEEPGRLQSMGLQRVGHYWASEHVHK